VSTFIVLFFVGLVLSLVGSIWGLVQAFREDVVWGILYWFVPFASLVFYIKKWSNPKIRKTFLIQVAGLPVMLFSSFNLSQDPSLKPSIDREINPSDNSGSRSPSPALESSVSPAPVPEAKYDFTKSMQLGYLADD
jgi:hypothetical protein